jgi:hypothetical protein
MGQHMGWRLTREEWWKEWQAALFAAPVKPVTPSEYCLWWDTHLGTLESANKEKP